MLDFFTRQEAARRQTGQLLMLFVLAVAGVVLAVYLLALCIVGFAALKRGQLIGLWQPQIFLWTGLSTLTLITFTSIWKMNQLREGGSAIAMALGGTPIPPHTKEPQERLLRNVLEEMAIASGVPVPELYLLEGERGINAFAAGFGPSDAVICVTRGAVELLNRDELQGVMAHEFSHILNGDVLLNIRMLGWLAGIQVVTQTGEMLLAGTRHTRSRSSAGLLAIGGALYLIGYLGHCFAQLIKSAVSRQREFLADASAVQFTRHPDGLAGALKKVGGLSIGSRISHPRAMEMSHMFFGSALPAAWLEVMDSHPPLKDRIRCLEPRFNGVFPKVAPLPYVEEEKAPIVRRPKAATPAPVPQLTGAAVAALLSSIGEPVQQHLDLARALLAELPPDVVQAAREPLSARALAYGLLLDGAPDIKARQFELVASMDGADAAAALQQLLPALSHLSPQVRLPLVDLSLPALRRLTPQEFARFKRATEALAAADGKLSVFELTLRHLLLRHLEPTFSPAHHRAVEIYGVRGVQDHCSCVLTTLARVGSRAETAAAAAFAAAVKLLEEPKAEFAFLPAAACTGPSLQQAFAALERTSPLIKKKLLAAALECIVHDQAVQLEEIELFRGIADAVGCPVPPWLNLATPSATIPDSAVGAHASREVSDAQAPL
ncbi:M48 family metallopeptidase [Geomonas propionica]|uniref:M48 family metalloprotease n=1 Tax=Geomonas propionica TaxID=2798582 RepID=A0ABS0YMG0_9BACT|nr:M48 family metallopeptidase [Geomonas propionica]MBJ6799144.1 M48 family metalloprotease [Geomonas propionica]